MNVEVGKELFEKDESSKKKRGGDGALPLILPEQVKDGSECKEKRSSDSFTIFIKGIVRNHLVILKVFRLLQNRDILPFLRGKDLVLFAEEREKKLRRVVKDLRLDPS